MDSRIFIPLLATVSLFILAAETAHAQTVTVTISDDIIDVDWQTATVSDLPGPDGVVSFSEALIASNNTPGHQTIAFAIPVSDWQLQWLYPGRAVLRTSLGFRAFDEVTIDGTTQTAFTGDTHPDGWEVTIYGGGIYLNGDNSTLLGFDGIPLTVTGSNGLVQGNTGNMNITVYGGSGSLIQGNAGGTIKLDRSSNNVVVGNVVSRVRVQGWDPLAVGNRIGGPNPEDRNLIYGYGTTNSEGLPAGTAVELFYTLDTVVENNWIGTADGLTQGNSFCTTGVSFDSQNENVMVRDNLISGILGHGQGPHHAGQLFGRGILVSGTVTGAAITGNTIGPDINGDPLLGSVWGVDLGDPVTHPLSGSGLVLTDNEIAGHRLNGVTVGRLTTAARLSGNSIHDNGWLGIDLIPSGYGYGVSPNDLLDADAGGNGLQNFPDVASVLRQGSSLRLRGTLSSSPSGSFTLEFFASPACDDSGHGEGRQFLGSAPVTTDGSGLGPFDVLLPGPVAAGWLLTATATLEPAGATSEFSSCVATVWRDEGSALAGVAGEPLLVGNGDLAAGSSNQVRLSGAAPNALSATFIALAGASVPFRGGILRPYPPIVPAVIVQTDGAGAVSLPFNMPSGAAPGLEVWFQCAIQDAAAIHGVALSNAIVGITP